MDHKREVLNHMLVVLFNQILSIEEKSLKRGPYKELTMSELHVIEAIGTGDKHPMSYIAQKLDVTVGTLTIAMNTLVRKGYVTRNRGKEDKRVVEVALSERGRAAFAHHTAFHEEMIGYTMSILDEAESDVLIKTLTKITKYFDQKYAQAKYEKIGEEDENKIDNR